MSRSSTSPLPPMPVPNSAPNSRVAVRSQACERCWKRKQKCDKVVPACSSCAELGIACNARSQNFLGEGKGLSYRSVPDYVTTLKRKVEQLESVSQEKRVRLSSESQSQSSGSSCTHAPRTYQHQVQGNVPPRSNDTPQGDTNDGAVQATMGEIGLLSLSAMAEPHYQSAESARHLSLENMLRAAVAFQEGESTQMPLGARSWGIPAGISKIMASQPITIERNNMIRYVDRYIQEIGLSFAYIDHANLTEDFEAVSASHQAGGDTEVGSQSPYRDFNVYMAIAIGALLSPESNRLESFICSLHAASMKLFSVILNANDDLITIKAMLLLLIYSIFSPNGGSTWHLLGLTMKKCISVRLHKEIDVQMGLPESEIVERKRLFWSLYVIDRSVASVIDRPFSIQDEDISVLFPEKSKSDHTEKFGTSFSQHLVTHARLISDVRTKRRCTALSDYSNLSFWKETSPSFHKLGFSQEQVSRHVEQLYCRTMQQIFTPDSHTKIGRHSMIRSCYDIEKEVTSSCVRFITCLHDRSDYGYFAASLLDGYDIFSAGMIYLYISFCSETGSQQRLVQASKVVNMCSTLLTVIGERFPSIKSFRRILNAMLNISMEGFTSRDAKHIQWSTLQNLPNCVPARIRRLIHLFLNPGLSATLFTAAHEIPNFYNLALDFIIGIKQSMEHLSEHFRSPPPSANFHNCYRRRCIVLLESQLSYLHQLTMAPTSTLDLEQNISSHQGSTKTAKPTVYLLDQFHPQAIEHARDLFNLVLPSDERFSDWKQNATAILMKSSSLTAEDIASCPNLIAIGKQGVGIDRIDQDACAARGIKILNTPGANARAVAELVLALTMTVARQIRSITHRQISAPVNKETCSGLTLYKKKIGIIGMGHIGRTVAEIFRGAFDAEVIAYDPFLPLDAWPHIAHQRASTYKELITEADVLTIHIPLTKSTRDLISYNELKKMKRTAILINAARGGIINEKDLSRALSEGLIWGAGLDCHEQEPPSAEKYGELWKNLNVVSTPHIGAATAETQLMTATAAIDNLYNYLVSLQA